MPTVKWIWRISSAKLENKNLGAHYGRLTCLGVKMLKKSHFLKLYRAFFPTKEEKSRDITSQVYTKKIRTGWRALEFDMDRYDRVFGKKKGEEDDQ